MSAPRRVTTRPEDKAEAVTNSLRPDSREILACLDISAEPFSEPLPRCAFGDMQLLAQKEPRLTMLLLDRALCSRLSLRLT